MEFQLNVACEPEIYSTQLFSNRAILLLDYTHTHTNCKVTDATDHHTHASASLVVGNKDTSHFQQ